MMEALQIYQKLGNNLTLINYNNILVYNISCFYMYV